MISSEEHEQYLRNVRQFTEACQGLPLEVHAAINGGVAASYDTSPHHDPASSRTAVTEPAAGGRQ